MQDVEKEPSIGISYNVELPGKKALVLQSFVGRDVDVKELNVVLDKLRMSADRQFAFGAIEQLKLQLEQEQKLATDHAARIAIVDENIKRDWSSNPARRGDVKLTKSQENDQRQAYAQAEESKKRIAKVKENIAQYEAIIGA